jgi:C1A family cysteine protease
MNIKLKENIMKHRLIISLIIFSIIFTVFLFSEEIKAVKSGKSLIELYTRDQIAKILRLKLKPRSGHTNLLTYSDETLKSSKLPSSFDWRDFDIMTPVKDQGECGSCWAFAPVGMFESLIKRTLSATADLSEQQLVDCAEGSCERGGWPADALDYMVISGIVSERYYPYTATDNICSVSRPSNFFLSGWGEIYVNANAISLEDRLKSIKKTIYDYGPVVVGIGVNWQFLQYNGGVFTDSFNPVGPNHAVVLVGWKDDKSILNGGYWILRNSWSSEWAEDGYGRVAYNLLYIDSSACFFGIYESTNRPPEFEYVFGTQTYNEGTTIAIEVYAKDPDGTMVNYYASGLPAGATIDENRGIFHWTPDYTQAGTYTITIFASDDIVEVSQPLTLIIQNVKTIKK